MQRISIQLQHFWGSVQGLFWDKENAGAEICKSASIKPDIKQIKISVNLRVHQSQECSQF